VNGAGSGAAKEASTGPTATPKETPKPGLGGQLETDEPKEESGPCGLPKSCVIL